MKKLWNSDIAQSPRVLSLRTCRRIPRPRILKPRSDQGLSLLPDAQSSGGSTLVSPAVVCRVHTQWDTILKSLVIPELGGSQWMLLDVKNSVYETWKDVIISFCQGMKSESISHENGYQQKDKKQQGWKKCCKVSGHTVVGNAKGWDTRKQR